MDGTELEDLKRIVCDRCGSNKFRVVVEQEISDVFGTNDDPIADRSISEERIISMICLKCGKKIYESLSPKCPECGAPLEKRRFVDSWDEHGRPLDINEDWYCPSCNIRWERNAGPHVFHAEETG